MNSLENLHANRMMTVDLGLLKDLEIISVLSHDAADEYSVDEDGSIWGHSVNRNCDYFLSLLQTIKTVGGRIYIPPLYIDIRVI